MKLSKKILSVALCGLIVVGGSKATLVKANAQKWEQTVRLKTCMKGFPSLSDGYSMTLAYDGTQLRLVGRTDMSIFKTFYDIFHIKVSKNGSENFNQSQVFRRSSADAGAALGRVKTWFNGLNIRNGDFITIHGEKYNDSVTFPNPSSIIQDKDLDKKLKHYNYALGYQTVHRNHTAFRVTERGLVPIWVYETL